MLGYDEERVGFLIRAGWITARSFVETTGHIDCGEPGCPVCEDFLEVLDIERAVTAMEKDSPAAALIVVGLMHGFTFHELKRAFAGAGVAGRYAQARHELAHWLMRTDCPGKKCPLRDQR